MEQFFSITTQLIPTIVIVIGFIVAIGRERLARIKTLRKTIDELQVQLKEYREQLALMETNCNKQKLELDLIRPIAAKIPLMEIEKENFINRIKELQNQMSEKQK